MINFLDWTVCLSFKSRSAGDSTTTELGNHSLLLGRDRLKVVNHWQW